MLAAQQETQWLIRQLTARVKEAYAYWWYTNEAINLHHETRALVEQLATVTEQRLDYGIGSQSEMLRVKTELDTLDARLVELQAEKAGLASDLIPLLGRRPTGASLQLMAPSETLPADQRLRHRVGCGVWHRALRNQAAEKRLPGGLPGSLPTDVGSGSKGVRTRPIGR